MTSRLIVVSSFSLVVACDSETANDGAPIGETTTTSPGAGGPSAGPTAAPPDGAAGGASDDGPGPGTTPVPAQPPASGPDASPSSDATTSAPDAPDPVPEPEPAGGSGPGAAPDPPAPDTSIGGPANGGGGNTGVVGDGDEYVSGVSVSEHPEVSTVLVVEWEQLVAAESVWLEFDFDGESPMRSRGGPGAAGAHRDVVLGVPADTEVNVRIVSEAEGAAHASSAHLRSTGALPSGLPVPEVIAHDAALSSPEPWMVGSVENSSGNLPADYLFETFWVFVMDRQGRIVWYYADPASNATSSFQRMARDGEYLWIEKRPFGFGGYRGVLKMTLDWEYFEEIEVEGLADCIDVTPDGSLLYDANDELHERSSSGEDRVIWSCPDHFGGSFNCYTNTINYDPDSDSILLSFPEPNTVVHLDRASGDVLGQYGAASGSWAFAPPLETPPDGWGFGFQHFPNITSEGTLVVSTHMPGYEDFEQTPTPNQHAFVEFEIDAATEQLVEVWRYTEAPEWARSRGMVIKLDNGNYLANYGTGGVIREITPDKETVFHVKFDIPEGDDAFNKLVGNTFYIDDIYRLNGGPE